MPQIYGNGPLAKDIIVYKKALLVEQGRKECIVKLLIPAGTLVNVSQRKCRAAKAIVIGIETMRGTPINSVVPVSSADNNFKYTYLSVVTPTLPYFTGTEECNTGIHFFRTKREAQRYTWN